MLYDSVAVDLTVTKGCDASCQLLSTVPGMYNSPTWSYTTVQDGNIMSTPIGHQPTCNM